MCGLTLKGQEKASISRCNKEVGRITSTLKIKKLSAQQIVYINNMVLLPKLEYLLSNVIVNKRKCDAIHQPMIRLIKQKAELPATCANVTICHKEFFGVMSLWQKHIEHHISELLIRINTKGLVGDTTNMRLKQFQLDTNSAECILTSKNSSWRNSNSRNLGAKVLQQAKRLEFSISENEDTKSWNILRCFERNELSIEVMLTKVGYLKQGKSLSKLNIWHLNQLLDQKKSKMLSWRQLKVMRGERHSGKKAKWFALLEKEVIASIRTREVKEEYKDKVGIQTEYKSQLVSRDRRKKEWVIIRANEEREAEFGRIIKKGKKKVEVEVWNRDKENVYSQTRVYEEEFELQKKEKTKRHVALKEIQNISELIRKKDNKPYIVASEELIQEVSKEKKRATRLEEIRKFKGTEQVVVEESWEAELINQIVKEENMRASLKESLKKNLGKKEIVIYTDGSLGIDEISGQLRMGFSIVQIDEQNRVIGSHKGRIGEWFSSTRAELAACLIAVLIVPNECSVEIRSDSACAIATISESLKNSSTRYWMKLKNNSLIRAIVKTCRSKQIRLKLSKVKAHSGEQFNDIADLLAKEGAKEESVIEFNNMSITNVKFIPEWKNCKLETPLRTFVKKLVQSTYKAEWTWIRKKGDELHQSRSKSQNWKAFKGILESLKKQQGSSTKANHLRLFKVKCIENLLPTVKALNIRRPDLYSNNLCKRCQKESESIDHLISCDKAQQALTDLQKEVWKKIQVDERKETSWDLLKIEKSITRSSVIEKQIQYTEWLRGILREEDAKKIKEIIGSEKQLTKFWSIFWNIWIESIYKEIWIERCNEMNIWEKRKKISEKDKKIKKAKGKKKRKRKAKSENTNSRSDNKHERGDENQREFSLEFNIVVNSIVKEIKEGYKSNWL